MVLTTLNYKSVRNTIISSLLTLTPAICFAQQPQIAIVIDDLGYRQTDIAAIKLDGEFTFAIMPFAPLSHKLAQAAQDRNKEVIVHMPMEAHENNHLLGDGAITAQMTKPQLKQQLRRAIDNIPHAKGINNHMGSKLTTLEQPVHWIMEQLSQQQLYFLDSKTSPDSIGEAVAAKLGLTTGHRDIFLDNQLDLASLNHQFNRLISIAKKHKIAIAIAHPHPETIAFLSQIKPQLSQHNIELVPLSTILPQTTALAKLKQRHDLTKYQTTRQEHVVEGVVSVSTISSL